MDLRHLRNFIALAEEKQFTAAARRMNIVQSGLSMAIKELEQELGTQLVNRSTRKISLTVAGERFLEHARSSLAVLDAGVQAVRTQDGIVRGQLKLGILQSLGPYIDLPNLLAGFRRQYPEVAFAVRTLNTPTIPAQVKSGEVDLSFHALLGKSTWPGLTVTPFADDRLVAICSQRNPLAAGRKISIDLLAKTAFIDLSPERALRALVDRVFSASNAHRDTVYEVSDVESLLGFVAEDLGMAIVPSRVALSSANAHQLHLLSLRTLGVRPPKWRIVILTATQNSQMPRNTALDLFRKSIRVAGS